MGRDNTMMRGAVSDLMILSALHMVMVPLSEPPMISPLGWAPWIPYALHTNLWNLNAHVWGWRRVWQNNKSYLYHRLG